MWAIRILTGPQAGQIYPLSVGKNVLGRAPGCDIKLNNTGISKEHAQIFVTEDKVILFDLNSRNGTFVNGVRIQNQKLSLGDKINLHDMMFDILNVPDGTIFPSHQIPGSQGPTAHGHHTPQASMPSQAQPGFPHQHYGGQPYGGQPYGGYPMGSPQQPFPPQHYGYDGNAAIQGYEMPIYQGYGQPSVPPHMEMGHAQSQAQGFRQPSSIKDLIENLKVYIDTVAMPGVYKVAQSMEYKWVLAVFLLVYIVILTITATVPVISNTKASIQAESSRRALTIARTLAQMNKQALSQNMLIAVNTRMAELEEGVTTALIINSQDGSVIAPANKAGDYEDQPFIHRARKEEKEFVVQINDALVGASVPISKFNDQTGSQKTFAHAIILYDMGSLAVNSTQALGLFIKIFSIAVVLGLVLFFFLYKVIEHPLMELNTQLNEALREGRTEIESGYQYPLLTQLTSNITSALSRIGSDSGQGGGMPNINRDQEAENMLQMVGVAGLVVNAIDNQIIASNEMFDQLIGGGVNLNRRGISDIPDPALQQNITELLTSLRANPSQLSLSEIPFFGHTFEVRGQAIMGSSEPAYFLICLQRIEIDGGYEG